MGCKINHVRAQSNQWLTWMSSKCWRTSMLSPKSGRPAIQDPQKMRPTSSSTPSTQAEWLSHSIWERMIKATRTIFKELKVACPSGARARAPPTLERHRKARISRSHRQPSSLRSLLRLCRASLGRFKASSSAKRCLCSQPRGTRPKALHGTSSQAQARCAVPFRAGRPSSKILHPIIKANQPALRLSSMPASTSTLAL
jgi:hypothetical protein